MKIQVSVSLLLLALIGCSNEGPAPLAPEGTMIADLVSYNWKSTSASAVFANNSLFISGTGPALTMTKIFLNSTSTGTYPIAGKIGVSIPENYVVHGTAVSIHVASAQVGEVRITEIDDVNKTVSGTFNSRAKSPHLTSAIQIMNGSFTKIPFTTAATSPGSPVSTASAKIDNFDFKASYASSGIGHPGFIPIGTSDGSRSINFLMPPDIGPGTYNINTSPNAYGATYVDYINMPPGQSAGIYVSSTGTITISIHNTDTKRIEGTFSFTAESPPMPSVQITMGAFAVTYQ